MGLPFAMHFEGQTLPFGSSLFYTVHVEPLALALGTATILLIGVVGGLLAEIQVLRMDVLVSLPEG